MNEQIQKNMINLMKLRRELRITMNQRDNALHEKYSDLINIELEISMISKLTKERFDELVIQRTLVINEIVALEGMYNEIFFDVNEQTNTLDSEFRLLLYNLKEQ